APGGDRLERSDRAGRPARRREPRDRGAPRPRAAELGRLPPRRGHLTRHHRAQPPPLRHGPLGRGPAGAPDRGRPRRRWGHARAPRVDRGALTPRPPDTRLTWPSLLRDGSVT